MADVLNRDGGTKMFPRFEALHAALAGIGLVPFANAGSHPA